MKNRFYLKSFTISAWELLNFHGFFVDFICNFGIHKNITIKPLKMCPIFFAYILQFMKFKSQFPFRTKKKKKRTATVLLPHQFSYIFKVFHDEQIDQKKRYCYRFIDVNTVSKWMCWFNNRNRTNEWFTLIAHFRLVIFILIVYSLIQTSILLNYVY